MCRILSREKKKKRKRETKETLDPETGNEAANGKWHSAAEMETKALLRSIKNLCVTILPMAASVSFAKLSALPENSRIPRLITSSTRKLSIIFDQLFYIDVN